MTKLHQTHFSMKNELGVCLSCGRVRILRRRRMNTMYHDDEDNFATTCLECFDRIQELWAEEWAELNADLMAGVMAGNMASLR